MFQAAEHCWSSALNLFQTIGRFGFCRLS